MSQADQQLEDFMRKNGPEIMKRFNAVLAEYPSLAHQTVAEAKVSFAKAQPTRSEPTVQPIEGGYIIWKNR